MDRQIIYVDQNMLDVDQLQQSKNTMIAFGMALQAILGTGTLFDGLACNPTGPASLQVLVGPGSVYALENVDNTAYGSLAPDTSHQIIKQGINLGTLTLNCPAPGTTGQSINYLIQAAYQDTDTGATVLPYFDSTNPDQAFNGPNNTGVSQNTVRQGQCLVAVKAGVAATTGSQTTPAPDAGYTGLWVVTVANGQTMIVSGNITQAVGAPFIAEKLGDKISIPTGDARYLRLGTGIRARLTSNMTYHVATTGNDSTGDGSSGAPWATIQHAIDYLAANVDLSGFTATISVADGTYAPFNVSKVFIGGSVQITGNISTPDNCIISTSTNGQSCVNVSQDGVIAIGGFKLTSTGTGGNGLSVAVGGVIQVNNPMDFGACSNAHMSALDSGSYISLGTNFAVSGNAAEHMYMGKGGEITSTGTGFTGTASGTPTFSNAFAYAEDLGICTPAGITFSGAANGPRYSALSNAVINTSGGGANFFPGSSVGSTASGGQYL